MEEVAGVVSAVVDTVNVYHPIEGLVTASSSVLSLTTPPPPRSPLFPYTTLFRSELKQFPTTLLAVISVRLEGPTIPRVVDPEGKGLMSCLCAASDELPSVDEVKPTV